MPDSTSTKLSFLVGLLAALVLVPVLALAADQPKRRSVTDELFTTLK